MYYEFNHYKEEVEAVRFRKMVKTFDNFCPNFNNDEVECTLFISIERDFIKVLVTGNDDFGLEKEGKLIDLPEITKLYNEIKFASIRELRSKGFINA